jgi:transposase
METLIPENTSKITKQESWSKEELLQRNTVLEIELKAVIEELYELRNLKINSEQLQFLMEEQLDHLRGSIYGASSERYKKPTKKETPKEPPKPKRKQPSERYPNIPVREEVIGINPPPNCTSCGEVMLATSMTEDSEQLTVIPKKYEIILQKRIKYRCQCQACIITAPLPPRIIEGSTYSDEMILDVVLSKYCDLIPMHRYAAMAARSGLIELPAHSLIAVTHPFAQFVLPVYDLIKKGAQAARVLHADETPHKMLEGSKKKSWYLWGFSTPEHSFLECHDTRSADVASDMLLNSSCEILVTDAYAGYGKAVKLTNQARVAAGRPPLINANCNAHARRYFYNAWPKYKEATFYLDHYHEIYQIEKDAKTKTPSEILQAREQIRPHFDEMKAQATKELTSYPTQNLYGKGLRYFLENYAALTLFLNDPEIPMDNNSQEQLLRSHVVGRKTWYGTHSERGAATAAILFTLVETCKLNHVNPREYFKCLVQDLLAGKKPYTPKDFKIST